MFFFQAEDGIRDLTVTGVQTCALPISHRLRIAPQARFLRSARRTARRGRNQAGKEKLRLAREIGRASCRERVEISVVDVSLKKKKTDDEARESRVDKHTLRLTADVRSE